MKNLPIGIQILRDIIEKEFYYADKTSFISKLVKNNKKYFFLSRFLEIIELLHNKFNQKVVILIEKVIEQFGNTALKQITNNKYYENYISKYNKVYQIGIVFSKKKRNIVK